MTKNEYLYYLNDFQIEIKEQIWRKELNIAFDQSKIPEVEKLRDEKFKELDGLNLEFKKLDPADTTKITRSKRKDLEKKIAAAEEFTLSCDETITAIKVNTGKEKEKVEQLDARLTFAKESFKKIYGVDED